MNLCAIVTKNHNLAFDLTERNLARYKLVKRNIFEVILCRQLRRDAIPSVYVEFMSAKFQAPARLNDGLFAGCQFDTAHGQGLHSPGLVSLKQRHHRGRKIDKADAGSFLTKSRQRNPSGLS